mgnify:CR=1 FL=1
MELCGVNEKTGANVSVIIPARNEEANIARSVRSISAQHEVYEIIVVDDQSQDRTAEILAGLASEIPQLRIIRIGALPEGWTGKAYAVTIAAREAKGGWLLFTDADTEHMPGSLQQLLGQAETKQIDLLSVSPGQRMLTWWEKAVLPRVFLELAKRYRFEEVSDPNSPQAAANGQYILIRRTAYEMAGGHEAGRKTILEDVDLARRVKQNGGRLLFLPGSPWVQTRMYRQFGEMWTGWSKNLYLLYQQDLTSLLQTSFRMAGWNVLLPLLLFVLPFYLRAGYALEGLLVCWVSGCTLLAAQYVKYRDELNNLGYSPSLARYMALGSALFALLLLNSARIYRAGGRVHWKGRVYAAKESL